MIIFNQLTRELSNVNEYEAGLDLKLMLPISLNKSPKFKANTSPTCHGPNSCFFLFMDKNTTNKPMPKP